MRPTSHKALDAHVNVSVRKMLNIKLYGEGSKHKDVDGDKDEDKNTKVFRRIQTATHKKQNLLDLF